MFILDPDFYPSQIPDLWLSYSFVATNIIKFVNNLIFEHVKKLFCQNTKNYSTLYPKNFIKLSKIWVWDPRSGIRKKTYSGSRIQGQKGTGSLIRIRNTAFYIFFKCTVRHLYFSASFSDDPAFFSFYTVCDVLFWQKCRCHKRAYGVKNTGIGKVSSLSTVPYRILSYVGKRNFYRSGTTSDRNPDPRLVGIRLLQYKWKNYQYFPDFAYCILVPTYVSVHFGLHCKISSIDKIKT